jgi:hypothetical protein
VSVAEYIRGAGFPCPALRRMAWFALFATGMAILHVAEIIEPEVWP